MHLVVPVNSISKSKPFTSMFFGAHLGLKYFRLPKFIQKIDPNARMPRIFMDSLDKSTFYICVFSRNKFI